MPHLIGLIQCAEGIKETLECYVGVDESGGTIVGNYPWGMALQISVLYYQLLSHTVFYIVELMLIVFYC